eukprot:6404263-Alexandrium_andersonii.AAC.1
MRRRDTRRYIRAALRPVSMQRRSGTLPRLATRTLRAGPQRGCDAAGDDARWTRLRPRPQQPPRNRRWPTR